MKKELVAREIFGRDKFRSYSEFYLALAMGNVLSNRGYCLNMDGMQVDSDAVPNDMIKYYKILLSEGAISLSMFSGGISNLEPTDTYVDTSYFSEIPLAKDNGNTLDWSFDYAKNSYGIHSKTFLEFLKLGNTLIHLVAHHIVGILLGGTKKRLVIHLDSQKAKSTFIYVNIYSCLQTVEFLRDYVYLDIDFGDFKVDLDYSIFCSNGKVAGHHRIHTMSEKIALLGKYGMVEGSILELWSRGGMCENNPYGQITGVTIIRLDEIGDDFLGITSISVNKTKEEVFQDFYDIDESVRSLFVDLLDKKPNQSSTELSIVGVGINNHFLDEDKYITTIDESSEVYKLVTIDGEVGNVKMSEVDAIYWLLNQYDIEFNKELYKKMYYSNKEPLWDMYN